MAAAPISLGLPKRSERSAMIKVVDIDLWMGGETFERMEGGTVERLEGGTFGQLFAMMG